MADAHTLDESDRPLALTPQDSPSTPPPAGDEAVMTLVDHLAELRGRIIRAILAIVAGSVVGWIVTPQLMDFLRQPLGGSPKPKRRRMPRPRRLVTWAMNDCAREVSAPGRRTAQIW